MNKIEKIFTSGKTIPVVFATDKNFLPYMYVAISSLIENSSPKNNYDIVILYSDIDEYSQNKIKKLCTQNISIRFFNMSNIIKQHEGLWYTHWSYTEAMYYRFIIPQIFEEYEKVLYLDGDIIINCDITELYDIDLENNWVGAIADNSIHHEKSPAYDYIPSTLHLEREKYFSSGVMVFNVQELLNTNFFNKCIRVLSELKTPIFPDQDVLNIVCDGNIKYIDFTYNFTWNIINHYMNIENYVSDEKFKQIEDAKRSPKIIHYCGAKKAWKQPDLPYAEYFWQYARKTPFYEELIYKNIKRPAISRAAIKNVVNRHKIYAQYLRCKLLKAFTFGKVKEHYADKANRLKVQIRDYRNTLQK